MLGMRFKGGVGFRPGQSVTPPVAGYAIWFDPDHPAFPGNPNYRYPGHTNQGTLAGSWAQSDYTARIRRDRVTYNSEALVRYLAYSNASTSRTLPYAGSLTDTRFLHDGAGLVTIYMVITPRSTSAAYTYLASTSTATGVGILLQTVNGAQQIRLRIGNGSATVLDLTSAGSEFSTSVPHLVSITLHPYGGIGTLGATMRIGSGTPVTANWSAAPASGDSAIALRLGGTFNGHFGGVLVYPTASAFTLGSGSDTSIKSYLEGRFVGSPDSWAAPTHGRLVVEGDSLTAGSGGATPWPELITLSRPFELFQNATAGHELIADIAPSAAATIDTDFSASVPWNIHFIWAGTNDIRIALEDAVTLYAALEDYIADRRAAQAWDAVLTANVIYRSGFDAGMEAEAVAFNAALASGNAGADQALDFRSIVGTEFTQPTWWQGDGTHLETLGQQQLVPVIEAAINAYVPDEGDDEEPYDYVAEDGPTVGWVNARDPDSVTESAGAVATFVDLISAEAQTLVAAPAYESTGLAGKPCVHFNGTSHIVRGTTAAILAAGLGQAVFTLYEVLSFDVSDPAGAGTTFGWALSSSSASHKRGFGQSPFSSGRHDARLNGSSTPAASTIATNTNLVVRAWVINGTTVTLYVNKVLDSTYNLAALDPGSGFAPNRYGWGATVDSAADSFAAYRMGEWLLKSVAHDVDAVGRITDALTAAWS